MIKNILKEWLLDFDHPVVSKGVKFSLKNRLASGVDRFFTILPFAMVLSQELKLALIEAYYVNGRSPTLVRGKIMSPGSKWLLIPPKLSNEQIKRVVSQFTTNYSLKKNIYVILCLA